MCTTGRMSNKHVVNNGTLDRVCMRTNTKSEVWRDFDNLY